MTRIKTIIKDFLIRLLFRLLAQPHMQLESVGYLFGASTSTFNARKNRWEKALARLWQDKDLMDYLYYQAEQDKEKVFKGGIRSDLSRGARIRILFVAYSARRAFVQGQKLKRSNATEKSEADRDIAKTTNAYKKLASNIA